MDSMVEFCNVSFTYKHRNAPSVNRFSLRILPGEFLLLTGATGCGKSTLLKMLNGLIPHESGGELDGEIIVCGQSTRSLSVAAMSHTVGMVFQNPDDQIFSTTVFDEVNFVLENMGIPFVQAKPQVLEALQLVGLLDKAETSVHALSGGQKQRLAVAAVLAAKPKVLALDEPISQLDPQGAGELLAVLKRLNIDREITIVLVEHRLHEVLPLCHRVAIMEAGKLIWQGGREAAYSRPELFAAYGLRLPQPVMICHQLGIAARSADIGDAVAAIRQRYRVSAYELPAALPKQAAAEEQPLRQAAVAVRQLSFFYNRPAQPVLNNIDFTVFSGQFIALMGSNGAGKSTLLHLIGGLLKPAAGEIHVLGKKVTGVSSAVGMVLQNPDFMLFNNTVQEEIGFSLQQRKGDSCGWSGYCQLLLEKLGLTGLETDFPLALSRGQRLRVAIAAVLACQPAILLLDEPTTGQDIGHIEDIAQLLKEYTSAGGAIVFCTHDAEVAARFADRIVVMRQGRIVADDVPAAVFQDQAMLESAGLKAPAALLTAQALYGGTALTVEEVVGYVRQKCLGGFPRTDFAS
ncbi:ABC transporter ATP-binding protein [Sporomusa acidovorans]|uniref:HMP/thiamine import ATP-binding protein YkoD n=1 Tax=Sporomusa acidovorans (strain ATCC 49682 / DSM 3132 / Mol) TaxID=1123286 RepID=A0ABZ3IY20_SPOA4|nr:energy-coupling factor transporter ATPase [Sporomusa acidovorans]OZC17674.1 putative HMP/thiamine import ATP-binding protein YkoD [Sporomusa acidovorans DSM 3132]SDE11695.1 energy-coupling factor transport system ATP-binding protein [Sporomusa acidovorans]